MYTLNSVTSESFSLRGEEFESHLRAIPKGNLATKVFEVDFDGKKTKAIVKQIQYHPITYAILHIDLQEVEDQKIVRVNVPVVCTNQDQCGGVKLGGQVKLIKRSVRVKCKVADLPEAFYVNLQPVGLGDVRRVGDLDVKEGVQVVAHKNNVLVSVAK
jgi:large subunit ribosomal protein L25